MKQPKLIEPNKTNPCDDIRRKKFEKRNRFFPLFWMTPASATMNCVINYKIQ